METHSIISEAPPFLEYREMEALSELHVSAPALSCYFMQDETRQEIQYIYSYIVIIHHNNLEVEKRSWAQSHSTHMAPTAHPHPMPKIL